MASKIAPGAEGLLFFPSMMGGSTITRNPNTAGAFIGLRIGHTRANLARAVLEGISFDLKMVLNLFEKMVPEFTELRLTGGGSKGALWRQILANIVSKINSGSCRYTRNGRVGCCALRWGRAWLRIAS